MTLKLRSPYEISLEIAKKAKLRRLQLNWSQKTLSERSDVSYGTLKKFEQKGQISLESLLKISLALGLMDEWENFLASSPVHPSIPLNKLLREKDRKRGRK